MLLPLHKGGDYNEIGFRQNDDLRFGSRRGERHMNRQHYDLLTKLMYAGGESFSQDELAKLLDVSPRSVRSYISVVNDFLTENGLNPLRIYPNGDAAFEGGQQEALKIQQLLFHSDFYQYRLSAEERKQVLILLMLMADGSSTSGELTERLYISKATLIKDMEAVEAYFAQKGIYLDGVRTAGYRLDVDELTRRELLLENMADIVMRYRFLSDSMGGMSGGALYGFVMQAFGGLEQMDFLRDVVHQAERETQIRLNDGEYQSITHGLTILISRIRRGAMLPPEWDGDLPGGGMSVRLADSLCRRLESWLGTEIPPLEQAYLAYTLEYRWLDRKGEETLDGVNVQLATKSFIYAVSRDLGMELFQDDELQQFLASHLKSLLERTDGRPRPRTDSTQVAVQYQDCFAAVERNMPALESALGHRYTQEERGTVLLHITAAVERFRRKRGAPRAIVVCNSGVATAKFLAEKLLRSFYIDVISTTSPHRLDEVRAVCRHDLIITTVPLNVDDVPCIWVSPMLNRKDMFQIYDVLSGLGGPGGLRNGAGEESQPCPSRRGLSAVFPPEHVAMGCRADSWQEAIRTAGALLTETGEIEPQYVEDMIRCVEENGPYIVIVPGVALAHAAPPSPDVAFCAGMACFDQPVAFYSADNDPVWCVIALQATNQEAHTRLLFQVMNLVCDPAFCRMAQTATKEEMLAFIAENEVEERNVEP